MDTPQRLVAALPRNPLRRTRRNRRVIRVGSLIVEVVVDLAKNDRDRQATISYLQARADEINARRAFHLDPSPETLTTWCDANEKLLP